MAEIDRRYGRFDGCRVLLETPEAAGEDGVSLRVAVELDGHHRRLTAVRTADDPQADQLAIRAAFRALCGQLDEDEAAVARAGSRTSALLPVVMGILG